MYSFLIRLIAGSSGPNTGIFKFDLILDTTIDPSLICQNHVV
jgi:hypothetical protein